MRRLVHTALLVLTLAVATTACNRDGGGGDPVTLTLAGDSILAMQRDTLPDGSVSASCVFTLAGVVEGTEGQYVIVRGGRVDYRWWENDVPGPNYEWNREAASVFWNDSIISAGATRLSREHGFGQSDPPRPVRGTVTFDYGSSTDDETHTTNAWNFYCH